MISICLILCCFEKHMSWIHSLLLNKSIIKMNKLQHWQNSFHNLIQSNDLPLISLFRQWISIWSRLISLYRALLESEKSFYEQCCVINIIHRAKWFCVLLHLTIMVLHTPRRPLDCRVLESYWSTVWWW